LNEEYDYGYDLKEQLDAVEPLIVLSHDATENIIVLNRFTLRLRYKNQPNDGAPEDAKLAISRTKQIIQEFSANPKVSQFVEEAREVHSKFLKANYAKYADTE